MRNLLRRKPCRCCWRIPRLDALAGYAKPTIFKIDVYANKSWQITFEIAGTVAVLRRIAKHREIDRRPS